VPDCVSPCVSPRISRRRFLSLMTGAAACGWLGAVATRAGAPASAAEEPHWDYHSHGGAGGWDELTEAGVPAFPDCSLGRQSPIDIPRRAPVSEGLTVDYRETKLAVLNNGHTIQVSYESGSTMTTGGKTYHLLQFHFHSPSEHWIDGRPAALEAHFVHQADDGEYAVLGVLMNQGDANAAFQAVIDVMPDAEATVNASRSISAAGFLPRALAYYGYDGSFTTPPCTEGVKWHVLTESIGVSQDQISRFQALPFLNHDSAFLGNARPVQPLNGRLGVPQTPGATGGVTVRPPRTGSAGLASR